MENTPTTFTPIEGKISLEEACKELVHIAECMKRTHTSEIFTISNRSMELTMFKGRKAGITCLLDLIEQYLNQIPE